MPTFIDGTPPAEAELDRRYLKVSVRPLTLADMAPGYAYAPGLTLLIIEQPPTAYFAGGCWQIPIELPEHLRSATPKNAKLAFDFACATDPETRSIVKALAARARPWREVLAAAHLPFEAAGPFISPWPRASARASK